MFFFYNFYCIRFTIEWLKIKVHLYKKFHNNNLKYACNIFHSVFLIFYETFDSNSLQFFYERFES